MEVVQHNMEIQISRLSHLLLEVATEHCSNTNVLVFYIQSGVEGKKV
jgi:hypothetical protein